MEAVEVCIRFVDQVRSEGVGVAKHGQLHETRSVLHLPQRHAGKGIRLILVNVITPGEAITGADLSVNLCYACVLREGVGDTLYELSEPRIR